MPRGGRPSKNRRVPSHREKMRKDCQREKMVNAASLPMVTARCCAGHARLCVKAPEHETGSPVHAVDHQHWHTQSRGVPRHFQYP